MNNVSNDFDHGNNEEGVDASLDDSMGDSKTLVDEEDSESVSSDSANDEDDELNTEFDEDESYGDDDEDNDEEHCGGVLGPLSRGGTTGVVLDIESDLTSVGRENAQKGYFSSVVNYMASALTPDEQRLLDNERIEEINANYDAIGISTQDKE